MGMSILAMEISLWVWEKSVLSMGISLWVWEKSVLAMGISLWVWEKSVLAMGISLWVWEKSVLAMGISLWVWEKSVLAMGISLWVWEKSVLAREISLWVWEKSVLAIYMSLRSNTLFVTFFRKVFILISFRRTRKRGDKNDAFFIKLRMLLNLVSVYIFVCITSVHHLFEVMIITKNVSLYFMKFLLKYVYQQLKKY